MKSKTSLFKKGLIISDIKRYWWVSAIYTLVMFFAVPFSHYMMRFQNYKDNSEWVKERITNDLNFNGGASQIFLLVVPIIIAVLIFRYMQKSRSASLYHSLPLTRTALYFTGVLSALILFVSPILLITIVMFFFKWFSFLSAIYTTGLIFKWLLCSLLFGIMFISMAVFVGMFTGSSIAQLVFVYILNFLPMFLVEFTRLNVKGLLYGFDTYSNINFYDKMPMAMQFNANSDRFTTTLIIIYIIVTIALFIGGLIAFKIRKPETAGDIITFSPIRPVFIYGVVLCATLLGGTYFIRIANGSFAAIIFGYFVSSLISYAIVQMVTNKTFKVLNTYKGYVGFALILIILTFCVKFDVIGYVNKIPDPSEVEETYIGYNINWWQDENKVEVTTNKINNVDTNVYKEPANIKNITKLHKLILDNRSTNGSSEYIAYKLKNGKRIIRRYDIDEELYASALGPIYESAEYKQNRFPILVQDVDKLKYIEIIDNRTNKFGFVVSDKAQLKSFKDAISKDIDNLSYQYLAYDTDSTLRITITGTDDKTINYAIRGNYSNTIAWMQKEKIYEKVVLKPGDVTSIRLEAIMRYNDRKAETWEPKSVVIEDKKIIKELLDISLNYDYKFNRKSIDYSVIIKGGNSKYQFDMGFEDKVSPELQSYIDKIK